MQALSLPDPYDAIPAALRARDQWVVWRLVERAGKPSKVLYDARTGQPAKVNDATSWQPFTQACAAYDAGDDAAHDPGGYAGIGYVFSADDPFVGVDLDACRNPQTGALTPQAREIVRLLDSYTEVSPSGTGVHIVVAGRLPPGRRRAGHVEMYDGGRYFTVTGHHLDGTPGAIQVRQSHLDALHADLFPPDLSRPAHRLRHAHAASSDAGVPPATTALTVKPTPIQLTDNEVLDLAFAAANGQKARDVYEGYWDAYYTSASEADAGLCRLLAFYTQDAEQLDRLFCASDLYREGKWHQRLYDSTYGQVTLQRVLASLETTYQPGRTLQAERIQRHYRWQYEPETQADRDALLRRIRRGMQREACQHLECGEDAVLVLASPPGVGKSHVIAALGTPGGPGMQDVLGVPGGYNLAWIAERKNMREQVQPLQSYRAIAACTAANCPDYRLHTALLRTGHNTWPLHRQHQCAYSQQFRHDRSAIYQLAHVETAYPAQHQGIVIDELNLSSWLTEQEVTRKQVLREANSEAVTDVGQRLLKAVWRVLTEAEEMQTTLDGPACFNALDALCEGRLARYVRGLENDERATTPRPSSGVDAEAPDALEQAEDLPPVVLGRLWPVLHDELERWEAGDPWNSVLRVGPATDGHDERSLYIAQPRQFSISTDSALPPRLILDATASENILRWLLGAPVRVAREDVPPPPHMRHIAVRTGKGYSKTSMTKNATYRQRAIKEVRHLLHDLDADGALREAGRVGLITFKAVAEEVATALGIPPHRVGHFWGIRGSNAFNDCDLLIVLGTPLLDAAQVYHMGCALYAASKTALQPGTYPRADKSYAFNDARLQTLSNEVTCAELTQCAHRNRPLRYDGRTVITLCAGDVDYLPETTCIVAFPQALTDDGEARQPPSPDAVQQRLGEAAAAVAASGQRMSGAALQRTLRADGGKGVRTEVMSTFMREWKATHGAHSPVASSGDAGRCGHRHENGHGPRGRRRTAGIVPEGL